MLDEIIRERTRIRLMDTSLDGTSLEVLRMEELYNQLYNTACYECFKKWFFEEVTQAELCSLHNICVGSLLIVLAEGRILYRQEKENELISNP